MRADPTQLDQVLVNLAVNARDAMPDGGVLTLRTGHRDAASDPGPTWTRTAEAIPPGRYVMLEVADTGAGIAPDILPRIFDPFFTTRREQGGSGLGLSTVHGIVRQSGGFRGRWTARRGEGDHGCGIYLPRADDARHGDPAAARAEAPPGRPCAARPAALACCWWMTRSRCGGWRSGR